MTLGKFIARHIYSVISLCPSLCLQDIINISIVSWASDTLIISFPIKFVTAAAGGGRWAVGVTFGQNPHFQRPHSQKNLAWFVIKCVWHLAETTRPFSYLSEETLLSIFRGILLLSFPSLALYFSSAFFGWHINNICAPSQNSGPHIIINPAP